MIDRVALFSLFIAGSAPAFAGPLHDAAQQGDVAELQALVAGGDIDALNERGETPLTLAILAGHDEVVRLLIKQGAAIDGRNAGGFTPLHAAAYAGDPETAQLLLDRGADIDDAQNKAGVTPLFPAIEEDHVAVAELLIARGADLRTQEQSGYTALTRALLKGNRDAVVLLRTRGAECQGPDVLGEALHKACLNAVK